jgi:ELWxxDGT repeat protein
MPMSHRALTLALLLAASPALAATPQFVADVNTAARGSNPSEFTRIGNTVFFFASSPDHGAELWKSDGVPGTEQMVADIFPGSPGSTPKYLIAVGSQVFFMADDGVHGWKLWRSDGTAAGTMQVEDILPFQTKLAAGLGLLFFAVDDGVHGLEPWVSDGTAGGTKLLKDLAPGASHSWPRGFTESNGAVFFGASAGGVGSLWKTDGTTAGTTLVKNVGVYDLDSAAPRDVGGTLFFSGTVSGPPTLYKSDGTASGTVQVSAASQYPQDLINVGGTLFFHAFDAAHGIELWKSDGVTASLVKDVCTGTCDGPWSSSPGMASLNGRVYFVATDNGPGGAYGVELWSSDGTAAGTNVVKDILPGTSSSIPSAPVAAGGSVYFSADDGVSGRELWKSDGTAGGTVLVRDIEPGPAAGAPTGLVSLGTAVVFQAATAQIGAEPWVSDGTGPGTVLLEDIDQGDGPSAPSEFTESGGTVFFIADTGAVPYDRELYKTDGTAAGTTLVRDINPNAGALKVPPRLVDLEGRLLFKADDGTHGLELWKSDGTTAGTTLVKDIWPGANQSIPHDLLAVGGLLLFGANEGSAGGTGDELWKSDGTTAGTTLVKDIWPGANSSGPWGLTLFNGIAFFRAQTAPAGGPELWKSDGTTDGTRLVRDIAPGPNGSDPGPFAVAGTALYFGANDGPTGQELWRTDGTLSGTARVKDIRPGAASGLNADLDLQHLVALGNRVIFTADDGTTGAEPWVSDGTSGGTILLKDIRGGPDSSGFLADGAVLGDTLFFGADDGVHGSELWKTDGTPTGTVLVKDIDPGPSDSGPDSFKAVDGRMYFRAWDGEHGTELWVTDGTESGTVLVADLSPGLGGLVGSLAYIDGTLYFGGDDGVRGNEPWTIAPAPGEAPGLVVGKGAGPAELELAWSHSCRPAADYSIHEGTLGAWYSHASIACSTGGLQQAEVAPGSGNRYYLVVPLSAAEEGSYGTDSSLVERPASASACRTAQDVAACP